LKGALYLVFVDEGTVWSEDLAVEDARIYSATLEQSEGDFASLTAVCRNPHIGLLAAGRKTWAWLTWDGGGSIGLQPMFYGRIIGVPSDIFQDLVTLKFVARPIDFREQKTALAASMRVFPYYDPIWISSTTGADDDAILEAYSKLWDYDRITHVLTATDIIAGEEDLLTITGHQHYPEDLSVNLAGATPVSRVDLELTVQWDQTGTGEIDITNNIKSALSSESMDGIYFGDGLASSWPKAGGGIGGGWTWVEPTGATIRVDKKPLKKTIHYLKTATNPVNNQPFTTSERYQAGIPAGFSVHMDIPITHFTYKNVAKWDANRKRTEIVRCSIVSDIQRVITDPLGEEIKVIKLSSSFTDKNVEDLGGSPIGDPASNTYFKLERGQLSLQNALLQARAALLHGARCVEIEFSCKWEYAYFITNRHSVQLYDPRFSGGSVIGKVIGYSLIHADDGSQLAKIKIGCTVGNGNTQIAADGEDTYSVDYDTDYEQQAGGEVSLAAGEIVYQSFDEFEIVDDGLNLHNLTPDAAVISVVVENGMNVLNSILPVGITKPSITGTGFFSYQGTVSFDELGNVDNGQLVESAELFPRTPQPEQAVEEHPTNITLTMKPVSGSEYVVTFEPEVQLLMIPKTIDLEFSGS
jgi:hypothetical protein